MGVSDMRIRYTLMKSHIKVFSIIHYTVIEENIIDKMMKMRCEFCEIML